MDDKTLLTWVEKVFRKVCSAGFNCFLKDELS
jgi:hypothetical protein